MYVTDVFRCNNLNNKNMSDNDSLENESAKKVKLHYDTLSCDSSKDSSQHTHKSSQRSPNIIITETGQDKLTIIVKKNNKNKECHQRYREQNREKIKQREGETRQHIKKLQSIAGKSTSSNINGIELNNEEIIVAMSQSSSGIEETLTAKEKKALRNKQRQQRYREQNREKLKQQEAERRKRKQYLKSIAGLSTSSNINIIDTHTLSMQRNKQAKEKNALDELAKKKNALQRQRERQKKYREQNRQKLKQRERMRRLQNAKVNSELSTSSNVEFAEIINHAVLKDADCTFETHQVNPNVYTLCSENVKMELDDPLHPGPSCECTEKVNVKLEYPTETTETESRLECEEFETKDGCHKTKVKEEIEIDENTFETQQVDINIYPLCSEVKTEQDDTLSLLGLSFECMDKDNVKLEYQTETPETESRLEYEEFEIKDYNTEVKIEFEIDENNEDNSEGEYTDDDEDR